MIGIGNGARLGQVQPGARLGQVQPRRVDVPLLQVDVQVLQATDAHVFLFKVRIAPEGKPVRDANLAAREVLCRVEDDSKPRLTQGSSDTGIYGNIVLRIMPPLKAGHYRATAFHKASGAEYGFEFDILAAGGPARNWSTRKQISAGKEMPRDYAQELRMSQGRPTPRGFTFPEPRQWTRYGPSIGLPGRIFLVRQWPGDRAAANEGKAPGRRQPYV